MECRIGSDHSAGLSSTIGVVTDRPVTAPSAFQHLDGMRVRSADLS